MGKVEIHRIQLGLEHKEGEQQPRHLVNWCLKTKVALSLLEIVEVSSLRLVIPLGGQE